MASEIGCARTTTAHDVLSSSSSSLLRNKNPRVGLFLCSFRIKACHSMSNNNNDIYKQVGLFSLRRKIEDAVIRADTYASTALEIEEASWIKQEEMVRDSDLWDDPTKSNDILVKLANSAKVVDSLKDMKYKVEEAQLIKQLAESNAINYGLYKQAYDASIDVSNILDKYEISKLLKGPFDMAGACLVIKAASSTSIYPKPMFGITGVCQIHDDLPVIFQKPHSVASAKSRWITMILTSHRDTKHTRLTEYYNQILRLWAEQLLQMYLGWAKRQGYEGRIVDRCPNENGGINSATIEFEFECAYGYLLGEKGVHHLISSSPNESSRLETSSATVDVVPLFLENAREFEIDSEDLIISSPLINGEQQKRQIQRTVCIQHLPTGIIVQSSGERSQFANKMKALNRLKAKLQVIAIEQGVSSINSIMKDNIVNLWEEETRRYVSHPYKLVHDVKTGIEMSDLNTVLDGNIVPLIAAHFNTRE